MPAASSTDGSRRTHRYVFGLQLALGACGLVAAVAAVGAAVLLALAALGAAVIAVALRASWRQLRDHRRFVRGIAVLGPLPGHPGSP